MFFWLRTFLIFLLIASVVPIVIALTKVKPLPKTKGKKYDEAKKYDLKLLAVGGVCFLLIIVFGNLFAKTFPSKQQYKELQEYIQVDRYSYEEENVVYEKTGENLYMKNGVLYEVTVQIGGGEALHFEEVYLPEDKNPKIYISKE